MEGYSAIIGPLQQLVRRGANQTDFFATSPAAMLQIEATVFRDPQSVADGDTLSPERWGCQGWVLLR